MRGRRLNFILTMAVPAALFVTYMVAMPDNPVVRFLQAIIMPVYHNLFALIRFVGRYLPGCLAALGFLAMKSALNRNMSLSSSIVGDVFVAILVGVCYGLMVSTVPGGSPAIFAGIYASMWAFMRLMLSLPSPISDNGPGEKDARARSGILTTIFLIASAGLLLMMTAVSIMSRFG